MLRRCIGEGFRAARGNPGITALLWVWSLILAAMAALPAWLWLGQGFNLRPESDRLLTGLNLAVFAELGQYDRSPVGRMILAALLGVAALALLVNPFVSGGLLSALRGANPDSSPARRFWQGGGVYYWRFFRLLVYGAITAVPLLAAGGGASSPLVKWFDDRPWEPGSAVGRLVTAAVLMLIGAWMMLALDLARARSVVEEGRGPLRNWFWALRCVWRHPVVTFGLLVVMAALFAAIAGVYTAVTAALIPTAWAAILTTIVLQQVVMFLRSALRVGLVGGELAFCIAVLPRPPVAPEPAPAPIEPAAAGTSATELPPAESGEPSTPDTADV